MSEDSPRWPGSDGSPGLDFSAPRTAPDSPSEPDLAADYASAWSESSAPDFDPTPTELNPPTAVTWPSQSDVERSQQSAAEWASRPLAGGPTQPGRATADLGSVSASDFGAPVGADAGAAVAAGAAVGAATVKDSAAETAAAKRARATAAEGGPKSSARAAGRRTRKARLRLSRLDPWSVMKTAFLFSIAFGIMTVVIAWVLWTVLQGAGALDAINKFMTTLIGGDQASSAFHVEDYLNASRVIGFSAVVAAIDVVILTAVSTLFAFLYNLAATVIGGLEVTLAED